MKRLSFLEWAIAAFMLALIVVVFAQVALRYLTYQPLVWTEEVARYVFIWLSLLGAAMGGQRAGHFAVDVLPRRLPRRSSRALRAGIRLAEASLYGTLGWTGFLIVRVTHLQMSSSIDIPMSIPYAALPVAGFLLCFFNLRHAIAELRAIRKEPS
jgi:TRAP-type transport system small permease protein